MAPVLDDIFMYGYPEGVDLPYGCPLFVMARIGDGAGGPAPDGTHVFLSDWLIDANAGSVPPVLPLFLGVEGFFATDGGWIGVSHAHSPTGVASAVGFGVSFVSVETDPDITCTLGGGGPCIANLWRRAPRLRGIPGNGQVTWVWSPGLPIDDRVEVRYSLVDGIGISIAPGLDAFEYVQTGLTNGTTYSAQVYAYILGIGTVAPYYAPSNVAYAVPFAATSVVLDGVRYRVA